MDAQSLIAREQAAAAAVTVAVAAVRHLPPPGGSGPASARTILSAGAPAYNVLRGPATRSAGRPAGQSVSQSDSQSVSQSVSAPGIACGSGQVLERFPLTGVDGSRRGPLWPTLTPAPVGTQRCRDAPVADDMAR